MRIRHAWKYVMALRTVGLNVIPVSRLFSTKREIHLKYSGTSHQPMSKTHKMKRKRRWKTSRDVNRGMHSFMKRRIKEIRQLSSTVDNNSSDDTFHYDVAHFDEGEEVHPCNEIPQIEESLGLQITEVELEEAEGEPTDIYDVYNERSEDLDVSTNVHDASKVTSRRPAGMLLLPGNLIALSLLVGTGRMEVRDFISARRFLNYFLKKANIQGKIPTYHTVLYKLYPLLKAYAFVPQSFFTFDVNVYRPGVPSRFREEYEDGSTIQEKVAVVLPNAWCSRDASEMLLLSNDYQTRKDDIEYPKYCIISETEAMKRRGELCGISSLLECVQVGGVYHTGRYLYKGDTVEVECRRVSCNMQSLLQQNQCGHTEKGITKIAAIIKGAALSKEGTISSGIGDVIINLEPENASFSVILTYHLDTPRGQLSSSITFHDSSKRLRDETLRWTQIRRISGATLPKRAAQAGILDDGRSYVVIPYLLFTDDFTSMTGRRGSCGGVYMLPLTVPPWARRGSQSVRVISLTPPGISSNAVLRKIVQDIVFCATEGVDTVTEKKEPIVAFMDPIGYVGDYPGVVHSLDVLGTTANAPCHLCVFRRATLTADGTNSQYAYTSSIHSGDLCFRRTKERMRLVREKVSSERSLRHFGLKPLDEESLSQLPLHQLSDAIENAKTRVPKSVDGVPVIDLAFDPYLSSLVAPSHLLYGLTQDVLNAMIRVCSPAERKAVDRLIYHALQEHGCNTDQSIFNVEAIKLQSMTISNTRSVLIVAPWAFRTVLNMQVPNSHSRSYSITHNVLHALYMFQNLVFKTVFLPRAAIDGRFVVKENEKDDGIQHLFELRVLCTNYLKLVDFLCGQSEVLRKELDKPNIHRLVELYQHSIPTFGHPSVFDELIFEAAHQPLKKALSRSNYKQGHLYAMRSVISNEWRSRLGKAARSMKGKHELDDDDCRRMLIAALGDDSLLFQNELSLDELRAGFIPPVIEELGSKSALTCIGTKRTTFWKVSRNASYPVPNRTSQTGVIQTRSDSKLARKINEFDTSIREYLHGLDQQSLYVREFRYAFRTSTFEDHSSFIGSQLYPENSRHQRYNMLHPGDVIQCLTSLQEAHLDDFMRTEGVRLLPYNSENGNVTFWIVLAIYAMEGTQFIYAQCLPLQQIRRSRDSFEMLYQIRVCTGAILLRLNESCVRSMLLHCCVECDCQCSGKHRTMALLSATPPESWKTLTWTIQGTAKGFPPRSS